MKVSQAQIDQFLQSETIAIAGVSQNEKKFSRQVFNDLSNSGYTVVPINPNAQSIDGHH